MIRNPVGTPRWFPPKGAPNILLIITDDVGFAAPSTFGGVIPTPTLDRIASMGLRYTQFHTTSLCSPTRAALITGRNHHSVGFGVIGEASTGYPGYNSIITKDKATIGRDPQGEWLRDLLVRQEPQHAVLRDKSGRSLRSMAHRDGLSNISTASTAARPISGNPISTATPRASTPIWAIRITTSPPTWRMRPSPISIRLNELDPKKPFLLYYAPGGTHAPHHPTPEWIEKFKGKFSMGWNALREEIFANQKKLGVIPQDAATDAVALRHPEELG